MEQQARRGALGHAGGERLEHRLLELGPEALDAAQPLPLGGRAQRVERVDPQLVVQPARALGPEAGQARQVDQPGRELRAQLLGRRDRPGLEQRVELLLERLADARAASVTLPSRVSALTDIGASRTALAALR